MSVNCNPSSGRTMEHADTLWDDACQASCPSAAFDESGDDRYPGTFFRVPGVPVPGKTAWNLVR